MIMVIFHFITQNKISDNFNNCNNRKNNKNNKKKKGYYFKININQLGKIERRKKARKEGRKEGRKEVNASDTNIVYIIYLNLFKKLISEIYINI